MKKQGDTAKKKGAGKPKAGDAPVWAMPWFHALVILVVTFIIYYPALQNDWTNWDDYGYVIENNYVQHFTLSDIPKAFTQPQVMGNYHPLSMISLGIDHMLYQNVALGYHRTAVIIHMLSTLLLFLFILMLMNNVWAASTIALVFAIHPMHVESVAWIAERKDLLYVCFFFAAAITWMKYLKAGSMKYLWYGITILLFVCSLLSKGQAVTFSVLPVLIDLFLRRKYDVKVAMEKIPFFALSIGFGILAIKAQQASEAINYIPFYSIWDRLLFASYALFSYIYKFFIPITLSAFHPYPLKNGQPYSYLIYSSPVVLMVLIIIGIIFFRRSRIVWLGIGFFLANIFLVLQLLPVGNAIYAERYTYMAYTGLLFMLGYGVQKIFFSNEKVSAFKIPYALMLAVLGIFFIVQTNARIKVWKNSEVLWLDVLSKYDYAPNANNNLGSYYQKMNMNDRAMYYFTNALRLQSDFPEALVNRSNIFRESNKLDSAIADCKHALQVKPDYQGAFVNLGIALSIAGRYDEALQNFNRAIELDPTDVKPYSNRANLLALKGDYENSLKDYSTVLKLNPGNIDAYSNRARTYYSMKKFPEALEDINTAIERNRTQYADALSKGDNNTANKLQQDEAHYYTLRCDIENSLGNYAAALADATLAMQMGIEINPAFIELLKSKVK